MLHYMYIALLYITDNSPAGNKSLRCY